RQQGDGGGVFGDSQFTSTLSVNFHFPKIPRRTKKMGGGDKKGVACATLSFSPVSGQGPPAGLLRQTASLSRLTGLLLRTA
ncbi:hypothetical protein ACSZM6_20820, partial [Aeromonas caviae]|uniref:hypothetical protein n=1 Tax=Aeromonas caviae TaxID=648 RepID=UPI003EC80B08